MLLILLPALAFAGELDGTWAQPCGNGYTREERIVGDSVAYVERNFWDLACSSPAVETVSRGAIRVGGAVELPAGAREIDFTFASVSLRPLDERAAASWRSSQTCGIADWVAGEEREVTGRACDFFGLGTPTRVPSAGDRKFGVVKAGEGELFFGRLTPARDGSSAEKRPLALDPVPYVRSGNQGGETGN